MKKRYQESLSAIREMDQTVMFDRRDSSGQFKNIMNKSGKIAANVPVLNLRDKALLAQNKINTVRDQTAKITEKHSKI